MSDRNHSPSYRRPLPDPTPNQNSKPVTSQAPVTPNSFYASNKPPPLPSRPVHPPTSPGSSHTRYKPPSPPPYDAGDGTPFREPELVSEEPISDMDDIPGLIADDTNPHEQNAWYTNDWSSDSWQQSTHVGGSTSGWGDSGWSSGPSWGFNSVAKKFAPIDGTDDEEERNWWDPSIRNKYRRPGPGILPPLLEDSLHHPDHTLFSVKVEGSPPDTRTGPADTRNSASLSSSTGPSLASSQGPSSSSSVSTSTPLSPPPTEDDLINVIPHPNAYYCRKHNGWIILQWKESSVLPPLAKSFKENPLQPLPDQTRRKQTHNCIKAESAWDKGNKTHHFHVYADAVSAHKLTPAFHRREWEAAEKMKLKRRRVTALNLPDGMDIDKIADGVKDAEDEGDLLDLYICCQCSLYCVASKVIPGVIPPKFIEDFVRSKQEHPTIGKNGPESVVTGWETVLTILENKLWKGENRPLPVSRPAFQKKMGWNSTVQHIFESLGFQLDHTPLAEGAENVLSLMPPPTMLTTAEGIQNRAKLLRAWVETSAWLADYRRRFSLELKFYIPRDLYVSVMAAREMYQTAIGAHNSQIPRGGLPSNLRANTFVSNALGNLGLTSTSYTPELLVFAYMAQCRCDPEHTPDYFTSLYQIVHTMQELRGDVPTELQSAVMEERSRCRYTHEDLQRAILCLGFGSEELKIEYDDDTDDDFIINAWRDKVKRAWRDPKNGSQAQTDANEAFRILAESRGSSVLRKLWEDSSRQTMNPDRAYTTLEIPSEVDDAMLLTVFSMRIEEQPSQGDKMREALSVIAEVRDSARLRRFLETGTDPGEIVAPTRPDIPRGLNQLGNTCYLNSLLQYFYTIKELRDAVAPPSAPDAKGLDDEKVSEDALKQHRVGGRLVTRREVSRSKKFVGQLANLFWQLEYDQTASVTPTIELAKLALVTSRDEEDEVERGGTASSNDTDATLVEDALPRLISTDPTPKSPTRSPSTILGKRLRDGPQSKSEMEIDSPTSETDQRNKESFVMVQSPASPVQVKSVIAGGSNTASAQDTSKSGEIIDVEMQDVSKPDQKSVAVGTRKATANSDSVMMFGKQHDVSECMDNCMFQIETALLKFDGLSGTDDDKGSIVKRLFYGKIRQRLAAVSQDNKSRSSTHEKEDLFSNLPVNVAEDGFDLYDGLSGYFDDVVEFEGRKARMEVSIVDLPPLLQVQLQRVQFNRETLQPYKSQAYVKFGETIYMDRFLSGADPAKKNRSKAIQADLTHCRERINALSHGKHAPFSAALDSTVKFLSKYDTIANDDDLIAHLNAEQDILKAEVDGLRAEVVRLKDELESIWETEKTTPYELTSVFVHRGSSPSWGHYFFYSRNLPGRPDSWFKYNDSDVSEVLKEEVLADTTGSTANPYLLVFARKGSEVIETVKRFDPDALEEAAM